MIIRSAFDVVDFEIGPEQKPVFAWLCAERAAGVWRLDGGRIGDLLQEGVAAIRSRYNPPAESPSVTRLSGMHQALLGELHPDCDFGQFHAFKIHALTSVAHALAAVIAETDQQAASQESLQSAQAEVSIVKGAYYRLTGSYDGVYEHRAFVRQIKWQSDDLASLRAGAAVGVEVLLPRAVERGWLLAEEIRDGQLI